MRHRIVTLAVLSLPFSAAACADAPSTAPATSSTAIVPAPIRTFTSDAAAFDTHSFWVDTGREVVVFDAQFTPDLANKLIAEIRAKTESPIKFVVVTHPNPDKFNGAPAFQAVGAKIVASESTARAIPGVHAYKKGYFVNVAKSFSDATYPKEATVDITFHGDYELPLEGATKVKLHELAHRGVSSTQTVAFLPRENALFVGDLVHVKAHAWLEGGIVDGKPVPDLPSWKAALDELSVYEGATVYGGRGDCASASEAVAAEKAYLDQMGRLVTTYVAALPSAKTELSGPKAGDHYKAITTLATKAFPDYALPYMIEYGVYGLALQVAK